MKAKKILACLLGTLLLTQSIGVIGASAKAEESAVLSADEPVLVSAASNFNPVNGGYSFNTAEGKWIRTCSGNVVKNQVKDGITATKSTVTVEQYDIEGTLKISAAQAKDYTLDSGETVTFTEGETVPAYTRCVPTSTFAFDNYNLGKKVSCAEFDTVRILLYYEDYENLVKPEISLCADLPKYYNQVVASVNMPKTGRWEYFYFPLSEKASPTMTAEAALANQIHTRAFGSKASTNYPDAVAYISELALMKAPAYVKFAPVTVAIEGTDFVGLSDDMEYSADGVNWTPVTGTTMPITGKYAFRYAADEGATDGSDGLLLASAPTEYLGYASNPQTVIFYDAEGKKFAEDTFEKGETVKLDTVPAAPFGMQFAGWSLTKGAAEATAIVINEVSDTALNVYPVFVEKQLRTVYVDGTAASAGTGDTPDSPLTTVKAAWDILAEEGGFICLVGDTVFDSSLSIKEGIITIKGLTGDEKLLCRGVTFNRNAAASSRNGAIILDNLVLSQPTYKADGTSSNQWSFVNLEGIGLTVTDTVKGDLESAYLVPIRGGGESGALTYGKKIVIAGGAFNGFHLCSKTEATYDVDFEYYGGIINSLNLGNDSGAGVGVLNNVKVYLDKSVVNDKGANVGTAAVSQISEIKGTFEYLANNGCVTKVNIPAAVNVTGKLYILYSGEGGTAAFTDVPGKYTFKTECAYLTADGVVYDMSTGSAAELFGTEKEITLDLGEGTHTVTYGDTGVTKHYIFKNGDDILFEGDFAKGEEVVYGGETIPEGEEGMIFVGWNEDKDATEGATYYAEKDADVVVTLYAIFKAPTLKVTFINTDGTDLETVEVAFGESPVLTVAAPTKTGYIFKGWALEPDAAETIEFVFDDLGMVDDVILYPVFEEDPSVVMEAEYSFEGKYNPETELYTLSVFISGGKFSAGSYALGLSDKAVEVMSVESIEFADGVSELTNSPIAEYKSDDLLAFTWAAEQAPYYVDAEGKKVKICTVTFNLASDDRNAINDFASVFDFDTALPEAVDGCYNDGYLAAYSVEGDWHNVEYCVVKIGSFTHNEVTGENVSIQIRVIATAKEGATAEGSCAVFGYKRHGVDDEYTFIAMEEAGYEDDVIDFVSAPIFKPNCVYEFIVAKNGYVKCEGIFETDDVTTELDEIELIAGDIKESFDASYGDGFIDLSDAVRVIRGFDPEATPEYIAAVDVNEDSLITVADLSFIKANFGMSSFDYNIYKE